MVSLDFNGWHAKYVLVESGAPKCYSEHLLFNLGIVLLASGEGSGSISNGVIILYEDCSQPFQTSHMFDHVENI